MLERRATDQTVLLDDIIASFINACETGEAPDEQDFLNRYPEFEQELRTFFEDRQRLIGLLPELEGEPRLGDDYEILELIDDGGQGVVYKAHQKSLNKIVAIKVPRLSSVRSDPEGIRKEARRAARLRHPNIVTVHHVGEHEGQRFCVMEFIEGQSLARRIENGPAPPAEAARYVKAISEAIHYAHQRELLHCDLKPGNILLDEDDKPYVTDFGMAKFLGEGGRYRPYGFVGGTASYMAPEQTQNRELTTATDVYGLGAILYSLLTGAAPFHGKTAQRTMELVREAAPTPPSRKNPDIHRDLEAICLKCLRKNPDDRYGSAYGVVRDLERYQNGEETTARVWSRAERLAGWCRRSPALAGLTAAVALVSVLTVIIALSIANSREQAQLEQARQGNSFAARDLAKTALLQLRDWGRVVEAAAANQRVSEMLTSDDRVALQRYIEQVCRDATDFRASCFILRPDGFIVARDGDESLGDLQSLAATNFSRRDYFEGAAGHRDLTGRNSVHISKVYLGTLDALYKFAISAPVLSRNGMLAGVVSVSVTTDAALGLVKFEDSQRKVALIAPQETPVGSHLVLFHPAYHRGDRAVEFPHQNSIATPGQEGHGLELDDSKLSLPAVDNYQDPVQATYPEYQGFWIAAFAPVGNTGFFVAVQQRVEDALNVDPFVSWNLALGIGVVIFFLMAIAAALLRRSSVSR